MKVKRFGVVIVLSVLLVLTVYAWQIEPYWIEVTHYTVPAGLKKPVRLMLLSDLHTRTFGRLERNVLKIVAETHPDIIVVVGDCFTPRADHEAAHQLLARLKAPLGVWFVRGNWENWVPVPNEATYFKSAGVQLLVNSNQAVRSDLTVVGFDDPWTGFPNLELAERGLAVKNYQVALFHAPGYFDEIAGRFPLCLAGHTHGGQVRLPGLPPLYLPGGCGPYLAGWYKKNNSLLYVTRGVGTSVLPIRFCCRPEIPIITLQ